MAMETSNIKISSDYTRSTLLQKGYKMNKGKDKRGEDSAVLTRGKKFQCYKCKKWGVHKALNYPNSNVNERNNFKPQMLNKNKETKNDEDMTSNVLLPFQQINKSGL